MLEEGKTGFDQKLQQTSRSNALHLAQPLHSELNYFLCGLGGQDCRHDILNPNLISAVLYVVYLVHCHFNLPLFIVTLESGRGRGI